MDCCLAWVDISGSELQGRRDIILVYSMFCCIRITSPILSIYELGSNQFRLLDRASHWILVANFVLLMLLVEVIGEQNV